jgi:hypothetical protein
MADMNADAIKARVAYEIETADYAQTTPPLTAALVALYEACGSYTWDEANEAYDTALYRWEKAVDDARNAVTAILEGSETP